MKTFNHPNYELDKKIGEGGMSVVYLAEHKAMRRPLAIKFLRQEFMLNDNIRKRFISEGRKMFDMDHPNIVRVHDLIENEEYVAIVMDYVQGVTLKVYIDQYGPIGDGDLKFFFKQMLKAVSYIHSKGYIHRDLKPSNFMLTPEGNIKLFDFGIAKSLTSDNQDHTVTRTNQILGTPLYMSPEQVKETRAVTLHSDIYSLGVVLWQMVSGKRPYGEGLTTYELQTKILNESLPSISPVWDKLISRACMKEPKLRYASCIEFQKALQEVTFSSDLKTKIEPDHTGEKDPQDRNRKFNDHPNRFHINRGHVKGMMILSGIILLWILLFYSAILLGGETLSKKDNNENSDSLIGKLEANMVFVPGGSFLMGCTFEQEGDCEEDEYPVHSVTVSDFYIGKYEVTQAEWLEVMGSNLSSISSCKNCPVDKVSWKDVQEFLEKLNAKTGKTYRLPSEAEWEYAARGGQSSRGYKYSGSNIIDEVGWYRDNSGNKTQPIGQKKANELGLYDMSGNVWEWCADWYGTYPSTAQENPKGPITGMNRVLRGGSWYNDSEFCRLALRENDEPVNRSISVGFRLVFVP